MIVGLLPGAKGVFLILVVGRHCHNVLVLLHISPTDGGYKRERYLCVFGGKQACGGGLNKSSA